MEIINFLIDFILHLDEHLSAIILQYGTWTYAILFLIIFMETGFVVTPFLPGDSLLFAAGSFAALGALNPITLVILLCIAAILGDTVNYWIGHYIGERAFSGNIRWLKKEYMDQTHEFYEKHGGKTIILALSDHAIWKRKVAEVIVGTIKPGDLKLSDHHGCRLGKWYESVTDPELLNNPNFAKLVKPHENVHAHGRAAVEAYMRNDMKTAVDEMKKMEKASEEVSDCLNGLIALH